MTLIAGRIILVNPPAGGVNGPIGGHRGVVCGLPGVDLSDGSLLVCNPSVILGSPVVHALLKGRSLLGGTAAEGKETKGNGNG